MKTVDLTVTVSFESEEDYDEFTDAVLELSERHSGALSGPQWESVADDADVIL